MALHCGMIGLTGAGTSRLFQAMTGTGPEPMGESGKARMARILVPDSRLDAIARIVQPAKVVPATMHVIDIPGLIKEGGKQGGNRFLTDIRQTDAIIMVIRCFAQNDLPHPEGSINPVRDKETLELEMVAKDLETLERKMQRTDKLCRIGDKTAKKDMDVLVSLQDHLEQGLPVRQYPVKETDQALVDGCFFLTAKTVIYVCNVDEASAVNGNEYSRNFVESMGPANEEICIIAGEAEAEIARLDQAEERMEFLRELGLEVPAVHKLLRSAYQALQLNTFFTMGPKEVRAWTVRKGTLAPQAAGIIHSDMEKGFIRAEVFRSEDFIELGSEHACKTEGKFRLEGRNYLLQDGDIFHVRFNV